MEPCSTPWQSASVDRLETFKMLCLQAFKFYITTILNRTNTLSGRLYKEDPSVFSWELANEATSTLDQTGEAVSVLARLLLLVHFSRFASAATWH